MSKHDFLSCMTLLGLKSCEILFPAFYLWYPWAIAFHKRKNSEIACVETIDYMKTNVFFANITHEIRYICLTIHLHFNLLFQDSRHLYLNNFQAGYNLKHFLFFNY